MTALRLAGSLPEDGVCRVCGEGLDGLGRCAGCGAVYGAAHRCPHCNVVAAAEPGGPDGALRCRLCGGPRLPSAVGETPGVKAALQKARRSSWQARWAALTGAALAGLSLVALVTSAVIISVFAPSLLSSLGLLATSALPLAGAWKSRTRAAQARAVTAEALRDAWAAAAIAVLRASSHELSARELAEHLHTDEDNAERLLTDIAATPELRTRVTDEGELVFSTHQGRTRVAEPLDEDEAVLEPEASATHRARR